MQFIIHKMHLMTRQLAIEINSNFMNLSEGLFFFPQLN